MEQIGKKLWHFCEQTAKRIVIRCLALFHKSITDQQWNALMQFVKFSFVGVSNTAISYIVYVIFVFFGFHYLVGSVVGFIVSVLNSFYWNNKYVFAVDGERKVLKTLAKTFLSYAFSGLILSNVLLYIWVDVLHIFVYLGPIINLLVTTPVNFLMNKLWAFKGEKKA